MQAASRVNRRRHNDLGRGPTSSLLGVRDRGDLLAPEQAGAVIMRYERQPTGGSQLLNARNRDAEKIGCLTRRHPIRVSIARMSLPPIATAGDGLDVLKRCNGVKVRPTDEPALCQQPPGAPAPASQYRGRLQNTDPLHTGDSRRVTRTVSALVSAPVDNPAAGRLIASRACTPWWSPRGEYERDDAGSGGPRCT